MSTQDDHGIPLAYAHEQQGLRLLELPSELLDLISSDSPPLLQLKSAPPPSSTDTIPKPAHVVLCTTTQTYQLRQVQTSNSVFVLRPTQLQQDSEKPAVDAICAAATCASTLELQKQTPTESLKLTTPSQYLTPMVPTFDPELEVGGDPVERMRKPKSAIFADIPWSERECEEAWVELVAFELDGDSFRPTANQLVDLWTCIMQSITEQGSSYLDLPNSLRVKSECEAAGFHPRLYEALTRRISIQSSAEELAVDKDKLIGWIGETLFESDQGSAMSENLWGFLEKWKSLLPENLRETITTAEVIALRDRAKSRKVSATDGGEEGQEAGVKRPAARNWHEKFKRMKR